ncbi:MAG: acyl-CoA dehydrogenase [Gemmatimonadota bacterium]
MNEPCKPFQSSPPGQSDLPDQGGGPVSHPRDVSTLLDHPPLHSLLPILYQAWSDGILTPDQLGDLNRRLRETGDSEAANRLAPWLDPERPPSPVALAALRAAVRTTPGDDLPGEKPYPPATQVMEELTGIPVGEAARALHQPVSDSLDEERLPSSLPPADPGRLARYLDGPHASLRRQILDLLQEPDYQLPLDLEMPEYRERVLKVLRRLAGLGLGARAYPQEFGGGGSVAEALTVFETLAFGDLSVLVKFGVQFGLFGGSILQLGTRHHHEKYLGPVGRLALPGCYAMTERDHGSNVRELETVARFLPENDAFELHTPHPGAWKDWIGNAALHGQLAVVFAQLHVGGESHGVHALLVPIRSEEGAPCPGVTIQDCGRKVGLNGVDNGRLAFHRVQVPRENLLDRFAQVTPQGEYQSPIPGEGRRFFTMLGTLVTGRISIGAASVSVAKTALTVAIRYGEGRRQFGPAGEREIPILDYLGHQRLLLPLLAETYGLHFALRELIQRYAREMERDEPDLREIETRAAGLKAVASWHALAAVQAAREGLGGRGYLEANRLGPLRADADIFTTFEGANPVLLQLVARGLLSDFRAGMGDLRPWGIIRHLTVRAGTSLSERNPVVSRRKDSEHLRDPDFHAGIFRYREDRLLVSVARRLRGRVEEGMDSFQAMNECQDHLMTLATAHVERITVEALRDGATRAPTPGLSEALSRLAELYALSRLESHAAWHLEAGTMEDGKSQAIRTEVNALCGEVREHALLLVDGFGIPDGVLMAPDGVRDGG